MTDDQPPTPSAGSWSLDLGPWSSVVLRSPGDEEPGRLGRDRLAVLHQSCGERVLPLAHGRWFGFRGFSWGLPRQDDLREDDYDTGRDVYVLQNLRRGRAYLGSFF